MKNKLKLSEFEFRSYLLESYIDENGNKVSDRELWGSEKFFEKTGLYKINKYTNKKCICSTGTISYWKSKLNLKEEDVFRYHKLFTKKIKDDIEFEQWSKKNNRGHKRINTLTDDTIKRRMVKYFGLDDVYNHLTLEKAQSYLYELLSGLGTDAKVEISKFYETLKVGD